MGAAARGVPGGDGEVDDADDGHALSGHRAMTPLARFGFPVRQVAIALALTVRLIPLLVEIIRQVDEARRARGLRVTPRIVFVPVIIGALRAADDFSEALMARGLD